MAFKKAKIEKGIHLLSKEEVMEINKMLGYRVVDRGKIDFLISKIRSMRLGKDKKKNIAKITAQLWYYIIADHPFMDGNKRTASETVLLFLENNSARIRAQPNGIIYISLKIANKDISPRELEKWIYERLEVKK